eukprot:377094-Pelagomonas_calceolata.AAC.1
MQPYHPPIPHLGLALPSASLLMQRGAPAPGTLSPLFCSPLAFLLTPPELLGPSGAPPKPKLRRTLHHCLVLGAQHCSVCASACAIWSCRAPL